MQEIELIATASFGLEAVVSRELKQLGYDRQKIEDGRITFTADLQAICRTNLWLRSADRVLVKLGSFPARDFGELFDRTTALPWSEWLPRDAAFPVRGKSVRSQLHSVPDCQSIVKKAVVENMKKAHRTQWFEENGAPFSIEVSILKDQATLTLDTTGPGLHKRGYRTSIGPAPIKETLAAALVQLSFWNAQRPFLDPFCGSGTIPIEAALWARNIAPGLKRSFDAEKWPKVPGGFWKEARAEAADLAKREIELELHGSDIDERALGMARKHAHDAGVGSEILFEQRAFKDVSSHRKFGCVVCNPPYGERSGDVESAVKLAQEMTHVFRRLDSWSFYVITALENFETHFGRKADRRRKLYNGRIECTYYQFYGPRPPWQEPPRREMANDS
ncbi:MAG: class I SAM-dependent RNA methyltransferase [Planctomycetaceae bacterium]